MLLIEKYFIGLCVWMVGWIEKIIFIVYFAGCLLDSWYDALLSWVGI